jgi:hypothetical protein
MSVTISMKIRGRDINENTDESNILIMTSVHYSKERILQFERRRGNSKGGEAAVHFWYSGVVQCCTGGCPYAEEKSVHQRLV